MTFISRQVAGWRADRPLSFSAEWWEVSSCPPSRGGKFSKYINNELALSACFGVALSHNNILFAAESIGDCRRTFSAHLWKFPHLGVHMLRLRIQRMKTLKCQKLQNPLHLRCFPEIGIETKEPFEVILSLREYACDTHTWPSGWIARSARRLDHL